MESKVRLKLFPKLREQGFTVQKTSAGWMIFPPDKNLPGISVHKTESKSADLRTMARLKRAGFIDR